MLKENYASLELSLAKDKELLFADFLMIWLVASLAKLPLLLLQADIPNLDEIFLLCNLLEQRKATTRNVEDSLVLFSNLISFYEMDATDSKRAINFFLTEFSKLPC